MTVQQPEWASQSLSGERQQQQQPDDNDNDRRDHLHSLQADLARSEIPLTVQLPEFPLPKSHSGPNVLRAPLRDNARNLNQTPLSPVMHRRRSSSSFSSASVITNHLSSSLANVQPAPAYVGSFGATQVVSEHQAGLRDPSNGDEDAETTSSSNDNVSFSPQALALLNGFLDQLLFSFLAYSSSTSLAKLRPAVTDVLMPRLASEAIASAEEELQELLGDGGEEDVEQRQASEEYPWDLELVWKRTRLRVMVYIRLGDMEDDDEERYVREGELALGSTQRFSQSTGLVSWAAAIFLTSIVEFIAEQVLQIAGQAALDRVRPKARHGVSPVSPATSMEMLTVEDYDMERVALDSGLSRLWRKWRKTQRTTSSANSPQTPINRHSRHQGSIDQTVGSMMSPRRSSFGTALESPESCRESLDTARETADDDPNEIPEVEYPEHVMASNIPLPLKDHKIDIDEIEVPGLARDPDEPETNGPVPDPRRNSFSSHTLSWLSMALFGSSTVAPSTDLHQRPSPARQRSSSVPALFRVSSLQQHARSTEPAGRPDQASEEKPKEASEVPSEQSPDATAKTALEGQSIANAEEALPEPIVPQQAEGTQNHESHGLSEGAVADSSIAATAVIAAQALSEHAKTYGTDGLEEREHQSSADPENKRPAEQSGQITEVRDDHSTTPRTLPALPDSVKQDVANKPGSTSGEESTVSQLSQKATVQADQVDLANRLAANNTTTYVSDAQVYAEAPQVGHERSEADSNNHEIGVAQTSDTHLPVPSEATGQPLNAQKAEEVHEFANGKAQPRRPAKLVLGTSATDFPSSPTSQVSSLNQQDGHASPTVGGLVEPRSISISPHSPHFEKRRTPSPNEQTRFPASILVNRNAALNTNQRPMNTEQPGLRSESSPLPDRSSQWTSSMKIPVVPEPSPTVHEHPVIQRIASLKGSEVRNKDEERVQPLTSASIKGPEDFEMFVQGGDTVKYTLTPENVRDEPTPANQYYAKRSLEGMPASPVKTTSPVEARAVRTSAIKQALAAIPDSIMESSLPAKSATRETRRSVSRPTARNTSVSRRTGYMAREPRVMTESTRDFAEFIRSTGPDKEPQPVNLLASKSSSALHAQKPSLAGPPRSGSFGGVSSRPPNRASVQSGRTPAAPSIPSGKSRSTMQPRAATSVSGDSAELIDFIRNGPNQTREHRISRTVAPFRTTMDSEQLNDWSDQILSQPDLVLSTGEATATHKQSVSSMWSSNQASANSRSGLITSIEAPLTSKASNSRISESEPTRKAYRNKDPYAVPSDDEDDILMNPPPRRNEESMMDFLRDTDPAAGRTPRPVGQGNNVARRGSVKSGPGTVDRNIITTSRSKALPGLQITTATHTHNVQSTPMSAGTRTKLEARSPGTPVRNANHDKSIHGGTSELADFLRSSGPPEAMAGPEPPVAPVPNIGRLSKPQPPPKTKSDKDRNERRSIFGGLFGRRPKKV